MSRSNPTLARLERILVLTPWLLAHPGVDVEEVTERFGITREELAADLDVLGYCGLPGYGGGDLIETSLYGDQVTVRMADFFRRPLALSVREAVTLLLAGQALAAVEGAQQSQVLASALGKLRAALGADPAVAIDLGAPGDEWLPLLREAVAGRQVVRLVYRSASKAQTTVRDVEPAALVAAQGAWYLQGWCRQANAPRDFRLDRIARLEHTGERATVERPPPAPPVYQPAAGDTVVLLDLDDDARWVAEWVVADALEPSAGGRQRVTFRTPELEWVARLALRLGRHARVVAPPSLAERVRALAAQTLRRYDHPSGPPAADPA